MFNFRDKKKKRVVTGVIVVIMVLCMIRCLQECFDRV